MTGPPACTISNLSSPSPKTSQMHAPPPQSYQAELHNSSVPMLGCPDPTRVRILHGMQALRSVENLLLQAEACACLRRLQLGALRCAESVVLSDARIAPVISIISECWCVLGGLELLDMRTSFLLKRFRESTASSFEPWFIM